MLRLRGLAVGPPATGEDVVRLLEVIFAEHGVLPLVLQSDNGSAYVSRRVTRWLDEHRVVHLKSLPRTPQHNGATERAVRDVKVETDLGKGVEVDPVTAAVELGAARERLDGHRLRASLGYRTARDYDRAAPRWYDLISRHAFHDAARRAIQEAVAGLPEGRERRKREREAILATLQRFGLIQRTRGGETLRC